MQIIDYFIIPFFDSSLYFPRAKYLILISRMKEEPSKG